MRAERCWIPGLLCLIAIAVACASDGPPAPEPEPTAELFYKQGLEALQPERRLIFFESVDYVRATQAFQEVIDNYPYSEYATLAELQIADMHYGRGRYEEAASYYQDFVELHPTHERLCYALYRLGMCSFERMRSSDRDQGPTREAIATFRRLADRSPACAYAEEARHRLREAEDQLAEADVRVGDFYYDKGDHHAAVLRYRAALTEFPEYSGRLRVMARLGYSLAQLGRPDESEAVLRQVLADNPDQDLREAVGLELATLTGAPGYRARTLRNACIVDLSPACRPGQTQSRAP